MKSPEQQIEMVLCPGHSIPGGGRTQEPHLTPVTNFHYPKSLGGKRLGYCKDCVKIWNATYKKPVAYRVNPETGEDERKCNGWGRYDIEPHWVADYEERFRGNKQFEDGLHNVCLAHEALAHELDPSSALDAQRLAWSQSVLARDGYSCTVCEDKGKLHAHHKDSWNWCEERRFDIDNGVTVCDCCHKDFHDTYGWGNNTQDQWNEYVLTLWT
jgi:hypothetical protein